MERTKVERFVYVNGRKLPLLEDGRLSVYDYFDENTVLFDPNVFPSVEIALSTSKADKGVTLPRLLPRAYYHAFHVDPVTKKYTPIVSEYVCAYVMNLPSYTTPEMLGKFFERYDMVEKANVFPAKRSVCNGRGWVILHDRAKLRLVPHILEFDKGHTIFVELSDRSPEDLRSMMPPSHATRVNTNITNNNNNVIMKDKRNNMMAAVGININEMNKTDEPITRVNVFQTFHSSLRSTTTTTLTGANKETSSRSMITTPLAAAMTSTTTSAGSSSPEHVNVECNKTFNNDHSVMIDSQFVTRDCNNDISNNIHANYCKTINHETNLRYTKGVAESCNKEIIPSIINESQMMERKSGNYLLESQPPLTSDVHNNTTTTKLINGEDNFVNWVENNICNTLNSHDNNNTSVSIAHNYYYDNNTSKNSGSINIINENVNNYYNNNYKDATYNCQNFNNSHVNEYNVTNATNTYNNHIYSNPIHCNTETTIMQTTPSQLSLSTTNETTHVFSPPSLPMETLPTSFISSSASSATLPQFSAPIPSSTSTSSQAQPLFAENNVNRPSQLFQPEQFCVGPNMMITPPTQLPIQTLSLSSPPSSSLPLPPSLTSIPLPLTNIPPFTATAPPMMAEYNGHNNFYNDNNVNSIVNINYTNVNTNMNNEWMLNKPNIPLEQLPMSSIQREVTVPFITPQFNLTPQPTPVSLLNSMPPHYPPLTTSATLPGRKYVDKRSPGMKKSTHRMQTTNNNFNSEQSLSAQRPRSSSSTHARHQSPLSKARVSGFTVPVPRSSLANNSSNNATIQEDKQIESDNDKKKNYFNGNRSKSNSNSNTSNNNNKKGRTSSLSKANSNKENVKAHLKNNNPSKNNKSNTNSNGDTIDAENKNNKVICTFNEKETAEANVMNDVALSNANNDIGVIEPIDANTTIDSSLKLQQETQLEVITQYSEHELAENKCNAKERSEEKTLTQEIKNNVVVDDDDNKNNSICVEQGSVENDEVICNDNGTNTGSVNGVHEVQTKNESNTQNYNVDDDNNSTNNNTREVETPSSQSKEINETKVNRLQNEIKAEHTDSCVYYFVSHHTNKEMHRIWEDRYFYPSSLLLAQINRVLREERARHVKLFNFEIRLFFILAYAQPELFGIATVHHPSNEVNEECYFAIGRAYEITWLVHHLRMSTTVLPRRVVGSLLLFRLRNGATVRLELANAILDYVTAKNHSNKYVTNASNSRSNQRTKQQSHEEENTKQHKLRKSSELIDANNGLRESVNQSNGSMHCSNSKTDTKEMEKEQSADIHNACEHKEESFLQEAKTCVQQDEKEEKTLQTLNINSGKPENNQVNKKLADISFNELKKDALQIPMQIEDNNSAITQISQHKESEESTAIIVEVHNVEANSDYKSDDVHSKQTGNLEEHKQEKEEVITESVKNKGSYNKSNYNNDDNDNVTKNNINNIHDDFLSVCEKWQSNAESSTVSHNAMEQLQPAQINIEQTDLQEEHDSLLNEKEEKLYILFNKEEQERHDEELKKINESNKY